MKGPEKQRQDAAGISRLWKVFGMIPLFSEGGFSDATVSGVIRRLLTVWYESDGCSIASTLINGHSKAARDGPEWR